MLDSWAMLSIKSQFQRWPETCLGTELQPQFPHAGLYSYQQFPHGQGCIESDKSLFFKPGQTNCVQRIFWFLHGIPLPKVFNVELP